MIEKELKAMKNTLFTILAITISSFAYGQIGIGTDAVDANIILQIESKPSESSTYYGGLLIPRIALSATNVFSPVTGTSVTGLIVYNTATSGSGTTAVTPGFYFWDNTNLLWQRTAQRNSGETALFANQNTTTDINDDDGVYTDLFANVRFNNNPNLYEKVNDTTLRINEVGYYKVILNLDLASSGGADNFGMEIVVNDTNNIVTDNMYIPGRWDSEGGAESYFPNGKSFIVYVPINVAGHTLRVRAYEIDPSTDVYFKNANTSTISIEKIR